MALTPMQEKFCISYIASRDVKAAAKEAGYSEKYASKKAYLLLKSDPIKGRILELEQDFFSNRFATLAIASMGVLEEIILENYDDRTRLAAIKEVFKFYGLENKLLGDGSGEEEGGIVNIVFNEVKSRKGESNEQ